MTNTSNEDSERQQETRIEHGEMDDSDAIHYQHWDDTDSQAGDDVMRGLSRFRREPEWRDSDEDYISSDDEDESDSDDVDRSWYEGESNSDPNGTDDSDDNSNPSESSGDKDEDRRPPTKRKRGN